VTDLRTRLGAKAPRRAFVPISLADAGDDARRDVETARGELSIARAAGMSAEHVAGLEARFDAAEAAAAGNDVRVELVAMPSAQWEILTAEHMLPSGEDFDWRALLPHALAASCVDESLQDAAWWAERQEDPAWSSGDWTALRRAVLYLNQWSPGPYVPKG
jgi:hypothetical protein